jgi:hypothetical protein
MVFTKSPRDAVRRGDITCSVRIWPRSHVKVGGRYAMEEGEIEVVSIRQIDYHDIAQDRKARPRSECLRRSLHLFAAAQKTLVAPWYTRLQPRSVTPSCLS